MNFGFQPLQTPAQGTYNAAYTQPNGQDTAVQGTTRDTSPHNGIGRTGGADDKEQSRIGLNEDDTKKSPEECQTCKNRKYQDGSDEMVSFKSAAHISPESAGAAVRAHEQEHVRNAYAKASTKNGKVLSASVTLKTSICPECGRSYVSGGTTRTQIKYYNEENPYQQDLKATDHNKYGGRNADYTV